MLEVQGGSCEAIATGFSFIKVTAACCFVHVNDRVSVQSLEKFDTRFILTIICAVKVLRGNWHVVSWMLTGPRAIMVWIWVENLFNWFKLLYKLLEYLWLVYYYVLKSGLILVASRCELKRYKAKIKVGKKSCKLKILKFWKETKQVWVLRFDRFHRYGWSYPFFFFFFFVCTSVVVHSALDHILMAAFPWLTLALATTSHTKHKAIYVDPDLIQPTRYQRVPKPLGQLIASTRNANGPMKTNVNKIIMAA